MPFIVQLIRWEVEVFLLALFATIAIQLLTGEINTWHLLYGRKNDTGKPIVHDGVRKKKREDTPYFSPERVQMLVFTLTAAGYYLSQVVSNPTPGEFPKIPETWPALLGGSNAIYLGGKAYARLWPRNRH